MIEIAVLTCTGSFAALASRWKQREYSFIRRLIESVRQAPIRNREGIPMVFELAAMELPRRAPIWAVPMISPYEALARETSITVFVKDQNTAIMSDP